MSNRYVAIGGTNSGASSQGAPWGTLQYAADHVVAGDTVFIRGGTYAQTTIGLSVSGSAGNLITWKPEPATGTVYIRHSAGSKQFNTGIIEGWAVSYNRFEGITFGGPSGSLTDQGIKFQGNNGSIDYNTVSSNCHHNEVVNCTFSNIGHDGNDGLNTEGYFGMIFFAWSQDNLADGNSIDACYGMMIRMSADYHQTIQNNVITNMKASYHYGNYVYPKSSHGVWMADNDTAWTPGSNMKLAGYHSILNNTLDGSEGTFEASGIRADTRAHNLTIRGNLLKNLANAGNGSGIFMESGVANCFIYENIVIDCNRNYDTSDPSISATKYHTWAHNVSYGGQIGFSIRRCENSYFVNNIAIGASRSQIVTTTDAVGKSNVFKNNLFYKSGNSNIGAWNISDPTIDSVTANRSFAQWQSDSGQTGGSGSDPSFVSAPTDFHLNAGSPAIDAGTTTLDTATITLSPARSYNDANPDIGKFEYAAGPPAVAWPTSSDGHRGPPRAIGY